MFFGVDVAGWTSLIVVVLLLSGFQMLMLGIIGEYLGRTFSEAKGRPLYFIDRYNEEIEDNLNLNNRNK